MFDPAHSADKASSYLPRDAGGGVDGTAPDAATPDTATPDTADLWPMADEDWAGHGSDAEGVEAYEREASEGEAYLARYDYVPETTEMPVYAADLALAAELAEKADAAEAAELAHAAELADDADAGEEADAGDDAVADERDQPAEGDEPADGFDASDLADASAGTQTVPTVTVDDAPAPHDGLAADDVAEMDPWAEAENVTMTIPVAGGAQTFVIDEVEPGTRDEASLTISPRRAKLALATLAGAAFATGANEAAVVALSSNIAAGLGVPVSSVGLLATAFALTVVVAAIPLTLLTKRTSRRATLTSALTVWTAGVAIAATATGLEQLAAGRVVSALAHALFWATVAPTAASLFAPHLRAKTVTGIMLGAAAAGVLGTPLITSAGNAWGWQVPFVGLTAIGIGLTVALASTLPATKASATATPTLGDLPHRVAFLRVLAVTFLAAVGMTTTWTYIVPFFTEVAGLPSSMLPALFAFGGALAVAATMLVARFLARHAVRTVAVGASTVAVAWAFLALGQGWSAIVAQALQAAGWAVLVAGLLNWAMRHTPWRTEIGGGIYTTVLNGGAAVGPVLGGTVVAVWGTAALPWVSLVLTAGAVGVVATVDRRTLALLAVPRRVRLASHNVGIMQRRRQEWRRQQRALANADRAEAMLHRVEAERRLHRRTEFGPSPNDLSLRIR